jgi:hypothetical protein
MATGADEEVSGFDANVSKQADLFEAGRQCAILLKQLRRVVAAKVDGSMHEQSLTVA